MFYKSSERSTILDRRPTQRNDHENPTEDQLHEARLIEASRRAKEKATSKLSVFEKELLAAWVQD